jgi:hypothetical protein
MNRPTSMHCSIQVASKTFYKQSSLPQTTLFAFTFQILVTKDSMNVTRTRIKGILADILINSYLINFYGVNIFRSTLFRFTLRFSGI